MTLVGRLGSGKGPPTDIWKSFSRRAPPRHRSWPYQPAHVVLACSRLPSRLLPRSQSLMDSILIISCLALDCCFDIILKRSQHALSNYKYESILIASVQRTDDAHGGKEIFKDSHLSHTAHVHPLTQIT